MVEEIGTSIPERRVFSLAADTLDLLLFHLLQELVYHKDAERLLLRMRDLRIEEAIGLVSSPTRTARRSTPGGILSSWMSRRSPCTVFPWKRPRPGGAPSSFSTSEDAGSCPPGLRPNRAFGVDAGFLPKTCTLKTDLAASRTASGGTSKFPAMLRAYASIPVSSISNRLFCTTWTSRNPAASIRRRYSSSRTAPAMHPA